jgi:hypothetical protein
VIPLHVIAYELGELDPRPGSLDSPVGTFTTADVLAWKRHAGMAVAKARAFEDAYRVERQPI